MKETIATGTRVHTST